MIILPTKGRPDNLVRFIGAYQKTYAILPVYVVLDASDSFRYDGITFPENWKRVTAPPGTPIGNIFNLVFEACPNEAYYGIMADDVIPETPHWDTLLRQACQPNKIAWGMDGIQNEAIPVHPFIGGELVRELGFLAAPGIRHWFVDNAWKSIAVALDAEMYLPDVKTSHHHYVNGKARLDRTYEEQPDHRADELAYLNFMKYQFDPIINTIKQGRIALDVTSPNPRILSGT